MNMHVDVNSEILSPVSNKSSQGNSVIACICCLAWGLMSYWSINLVTNGILAVKLFPPNFNETMVLLFAVALQCLPSFFILLTPLFFTSIVRPFIWTFVLVVVMLVVVFELYHSVYAQYKNSIGQYLYANEVASISLIENRQNQLVKNISGIYKAKRDSFNLLASNSENGKDETGIAKCGYLCKKYRRDFANATARFSHLDQSDLTDITSNSNDVLSHFLLAESRMPKIKATIVDLNLFYKELDNSNAPSQIAQEFDAINAVILKKKSDYGDLSSLTSASLALTNTNNALYAMWNGNLPPTEARLPIVYGILPTLCIIVLSIYMRLAGNRNYGIGNVAADLARETIASRMLTMLAELRKKNFLSSIRAQYTRWDAGVK